MVKGYKVHGKRWHEANKRAYQAAKRASVTPSVRLMADGTVVGVGDVIERKKGYDRMLYGARGSCEWESEARARGALALP